ncbi:peptidoglycan DD-metalloendopeptidase family protein [Deinococcus peraridilitoris]|uniref:Metalloendopeptidase-like membrane protein n=1 Tax=Deinococcus peraridilitoris (strain DSM 19664 / LMG 22246 / CIP 109416 / KR-200) TaxID=937777 RepID=L0A7H1_DEIPD|nr:peptidoglycan DD-metalloendopeptidase family protein [Deinococcus peraridilitoris]AFZ69107.1 metalloendopeptidase-like membrane protein [Deinococcus peraridilitoris DSM 19664]
MVSSLFRPRGLAALALACSLSSASAEISLLPPLDLSSPALTFRLQPESSNERGVVHVTLQQGERARDVAAAYGVGAAELGVDPDRPQPAGAVLRVPLRSGPQARRLPPGVQVYRARAGDTLEKIARRFQMSSLALVSANLERQSLDDLSIGEEIFVPSMSQGLVVRLKDGQDLLQLSRYYGADVVEVARVNAINSPTEVGVGDYVLLPGVQATRHMNELLERRERAQENERRREALARYERYVAYQKGVERRRLQAKYEAQARFERYQRWLRSPERVALQEKYDRQARYQQDLARRAQEKAAALAQAENEKAVTSELQDSALRTPTGVLRRAAFHGGDVSWPMRNFRLTSRFGERDIEFHQQFFHGGIDLAAPYGTPIYAATAGVIHQSGHGDYGLNVWVGSGNAMLIYGHMSRTAVTSGQRVERGQLLGYVGCTGVCTGPHLHFEVRIDNTPVDPIGLLP